MRTAFQALALIACMSCGATPAVAENIDVSSLTYEDHMALLIKLGVSPDNLEKSIPLDSSISPFAARRQRRDTVAQIVKAAHAIGENPVLKLNAHILFFDYDFDKGRYGFCHPFPATVYNPMAEDQAKRPKIKTSTYGVVGSCADEYTHKNVLQVGQMNNLQYSGTYHIPMDELSAEIIYDAIGGSNKVRQASYSCADLFVIHDQDIYCRELTVVMHASNVTFTATHKFRSGTELTLDRWVVRKGGQDIGVWPKPVKNPEPAPEPKKQDNVAVEQSANLKAVTAPAPNKKLLGAEELEQTMSLSKTNRREIQRRLSLLGLDTKGIDGVFGPGTRGAISAWQSINNMNVNGYLDAELLNLLKYQTNEKYAAWKKAQPKKRKAVQSKKRARRAPSGWYRRDNRMICKKLAFGTYCKLG